MCKRKCKEHRMCLRWNNRPLVKYTDISIAGPLDLSTYPVIRALEISLGKKKKSNRYFLFDFFVVFILQVNCPGYNKNQVVGVISSPALAFLQTSLCPKEPLLVSPLDHTTSAALRLDLPFNCSKLSTSSLGSTCDRQC